MIKQYLKKKNMTAQEFSIALGLSRSTVSHWITGERKPNQANVRKAVAFTRGELTKEMLRPDWYI